jgi:membrane dipeptidase
VFGLNPEELHRQAVVIDGHCDSVHLFTGVKGTYDFGEENTVGHIDLPRLVRGGVDVQFFALYIEPEYQQYGALRRAIILMEHFHREIGKYKDSISVVLNQNDLDHALSSDRIAALLSLEGAEALGLDIEVLHSLHRLGLRSVGLTWNGRNMLADGVGVGESAGGLTSFGKEVVTEMNQLGMIVDAAHLAPRGFYELLDISATPVVVTHANASGVCKHRRNLDDDQLRALNEQGGVVGMSFYPAFISNEKPATIEMLLDHFCYIADSFGTDLLGIGSDYDGIPETVMGLEDVSSLPLLTHGLIKRGFSEDEITKILGGNFLRVLRTTLHKGGS